MNLLNDIKEEEDWTEIILSCIGCHKQIRFRYKYLLMMYYRDNLWRKIYPSTFIIQCSNCGGAIWLEGIKRKAGFKESYM